MNQREWLIALAVVLSGAGCGREEMPTEALEGTVPTFAKAGSFKSFRIPSDNSQPRHITLGSDGNMWFTESRLDFGKIARVDARGNITEFELSQSAQSSQPDDIVSGPDDALWFTGPSGFPDAFIGRLTTAGQFTGFAPECDPTFGCGSIVPNGITSGPDGNLWFTESLRDAIVKLTPEGRFTFYPIPIPEGGLAAEPSGITVGPDGALWFAEFHGNNIGRIDPKKGTITEFGPATGGPYRIAAGPDGNLWFTDPFNNKIGRFTPPTPSTPEGVFTEFLLPSPSHPRDIVAGPDGNLWFTEYLGERLSRISPTGVITQVQTMRGGPWGIGRGAGNTIWVTLLDGNKVARFTLSLP
jgi:virginiamycin B lyase